MQTHEDSEFRHKWLESLERRADKAARSKASEITAPSDNEEICSWKASNGIYCRHLPDDPHGILRISIGGGDDLPLKLDYAVIRGQVGQCIALLERALAALKELPE